jgi:hypothetical protein
VTPVIKCFGHVRGLTFVPTCTEECLGCIWVNVG